MLVTKAQWTTAKNSHKLVFCVFPEQLLSHIIFGLLHWYEVTLIKRYNKPLLQKSETKILKQSSHRRCSMKKDFLENFAIFIGKHHSWSYFLIKLQAWITGTSLKRDSSAGVFLWILRNFLEHLFWRTSANGCFLKRRHWFSTNEILKFYRRDVIGTSNWNFSIFFQLIF